MPVQLKDGDTIDSKYRIVRSIGQGGMGAVVCVESLEDGENYALKYCKENDESLLRRFSREVRIMQGIHHRHVMPVLDSNLGYRPPYFVMPLARHSLHDEIDTLKQDEDLALAAFEQVCLGINAIHSSNGVHRDIKPMNALRLEDDRIVVSDLGLAKIDPRDTTTLTQTDVRIGTFIYSAPEQFMPGGSKEADARTDIFQLGKTLYELLTGKSPALMDLKALSAGLAHIIQRAAKVNPDDRYKNVGELMDALEYYQRAKDPAQNPREAFENLLQQAKSDLEQNQYDLDDLKAMLAILGNGVRLGDESVLELLDKVPIQLLPVVGKELTDDFLPVLRKYAEALRRLAGGHPFEYAERVAKRMKAVFNEAKSAELKALALLATMIASVELNRYAAMNVFDELILSVKSVEDAMPVADMLRQNRDYYRRLAPRVPADRLYHVIRDVRDEVLDRTP